ncbi:MAG: PAS domain-containing protein, partial [Marmoricola sp.]
MDTTIHEGQLIGLAGLSASAADPGRLISGALPVLAALAGADSLLVVQDEGDTLLPEHHLGTALDTSELVLDAAGEVGRLIGVPIPLAWHHLGVRRVSAQRLPGHCGVLVLAWLEASPALTPSLEIALSMLDTAIGRLEAQGALADLAARVDNAQILANMGDYDWHIPSDTNTWSDQLFRIYGHEPKSFNPSYERFLSLIHPEDRERISGLHQDAYSTGEPYSMIERIVRPHGEVRYLSSNGQVVMDEAGAPVRMRGTCIDITDRVLAEAERELSAARFRALVESAPDALLVLDDDGRVLEANPRALELLGGSPSNHLIQEVLPTQALKGGLGIEGTRL